MKRIASKTLAVFLALITVVALIPMTLSVSAAWSGGRSEKFAAGTGSEADPYLITSAEDLAYLAYTVNTGNLYAGTYFQLTGDIDLSGKNWDPIGNYVSNIEIFKGIFDGAGYTVSGLSCDITTSYAGLFGRIESGVIKNLNVKGPLVKGIKWTGGIVGYALNSSEIINCSTAIDLVQGFVVGGIVGRIQHLGESLEYNKITGCFSSSNCRTITGDSVFIGGIAGACGATIVSYCGNTGSIDLAEGATTLALAGGIVGVEGADNVTAHIRNCYNTGEVKALSTLPSTYAGGIVGRAAHIQDFINYSDVVDCFTTGKVSVKDSSGALLDGKFGSVIGHIRYSANIGNCYTSLPAAECVEVGTDDLASLEAGDIAVLTPAQMSGPEAINTMKLGEGWVANASGLPTIDVAAALVAAEKPVETTAAETTVLTDAPVVTTAAPVVTTAPVKETTAAPVVTTAEPVETTSTPENTDDVSDEDGGVNIYVILIFVVIAAAAGAIIYIVISEKKKK